MKTNGCRIISLEACEIYKRIKANGEEIGFDLPEKNSFAYFCLFKNVLDYSLDSIELERAYPSICRKKFLFTDKNNNEYTLAVINLKFNYTYKSLDDWKTLKQLREYFYEYGFNLGGVHYIRYKRSSGSSRQGKCLFIDERMYKHMAKWGECGLLPNADIASWESYKSLSLSSIKGTINIPLNSILFIKDYKSTFEEDVVSVEEVDGELISQKKIATIKNDIWDGESLIDESVFLGDYADKHMLLLRNKFFKSCAFRTKLQKWFLDKNISSIDELKARGFITFASDISQILMVTTPNSMKFIKFMQGGFTESNIRKWMEKIDDNFGVVKFDKRTKFFDGKMVQTSYQFINTLGIDEEKSKQLLENSIKYLTTIRDDYDFMRYHFSHAYKRETDGEHEEIADGLAERSDVIFRLMSINNAFKDTVLYSNFRNDVVENQKNRLKEGHVLLSGTNATLFGNGPEMLLALSGEFDIDNPNNESCSLNKGEVACAKFDNGKKLVCARSPHITMGNLYCVSNNITHPIWEYFDLGENIVCVNAIRENIQQRLNGCDYDSDTMLLTDDSFIVQILSRQDGTFDVPVCNIQSSAKENQTIAELDYSTSENKIGQIVNMSQKLNSILWDKLNTGEGAQEEISAIYKDICILAVLSGIEIDKAKRAYENINVGAELHNLTNKYGTVRPKFFEFFDEQEIERKIRYIKDPMKRALKRFELARGDYQFFNTAMEYVFRFADEIDYRKGRMKQKKYIPIINTIKEPDKPKVSTVYSQKDAIIELCENYKEEIHKLYKELSCSDEDEKEIVYSKIQEKKAERNSAVNKLLTTEYVLYLVLKHYDKVGSENWHIYAPLLESELFLRMLKRSKEKLSVVVECTKGEFALYDKKYTKI